jgi:hypothetical protein
MRCPSINDGVESRLSHPLCARSSSPRSRTLRQLFRLSVKRSPDRDQSQTAGIRRGPLGPGFAVAPCQGSIDVAAAHRTGSTISPYREHWGRVVLMPYAPLVACRILSFCKNFRARCSTIFFCRASMIPAFQRHTAFSVMSSAEAASPMGKMRSTLSCMITIPPST